jgi:hypothetical protein
VLDQFEYRPAVSYQENADPETAEGAKSGLGRTNDKSATGPAGTACRRYKQGFAAQGPCRYPQPLQHKPPPQLDHGQHKRHRTTED